MNEPTDPRFDDLDIDIERRIDAICRRFEADWRAGKRPQIDDYLADDPSGAPDAARSALRAELEALDDELRQSDDTTARIDRIEAPEAPLPAMIAETPLIAPVPRPILPLPGASPLSAHGDATAPPGDDATVDFVSADPAHPEAPSPTRVRYFGDYEIIREIARGGMGIVFQARQISLNRPVALKMIRFATLASDDALRRFQNEAEAVATLDHPHIVPIFEVGNHAGQHYFTMKLIDGSSLDKKLTDHLAQPKAAATLLKKAAEAVHHAHQRGILHRDLKPANILVDERGEPFVADFGLAKRYADESGLTHSGAIMGTPSYMSPEQASGRRGAVTTSSDVYGLGAILYALLTGRAPFVGDSVEDTLEQVRSAAPLPPSKFNPFAARDLELICLKCLEKDPLGRYPTAGALATDLGRFAAGEPVSVRAAGVVERVAKWARRKPTLAAAYALGLVAVLLGGLGGGAAWRWRAAERERETAETGRGEAERQREVLERFDYGRQIQAALEKSRENDVRAALALLESTRTDLRSWEWRYVNRLCHPELLTLRGHTAPVHAASFSPDGSRIVTGSDDTTARIWDAQSGSLVHELMGPGQVVSASFSPDGSRVLTANTHDSVNVWDTLSGAEVLSLKGRVWMPRSASFSPDGSRIVTGDLHKTAKVWGAQIGVELLTLEGHAFGIRSASFSSDGSRIVTGSDDNTAKVWDALTGAELLTFKGHKGQVYSASFSPDGTRVVTGSFDHTAKVWNSTTGAEIVTLERHAREVTSASFSPDGSRVVTTNPEKTATIWNAKTGAEVLTLKGHIGYLATASFSRDGSRIVTGSYDKTAKVWDARNSVECLTLRGHRTRINSASFSPDGSRVVTASLDNTAKVWDARTGVELLTLKGHAFGAASASFNPDGSRIVTVSGDRTAKIWDARTGANVLTLTGHITDVRSASFSPDGSRIVTANHGRTAKVWDATSGVEVLILKGHTNSVSSASFSPDGSRVVTTCEDFTAKVWDTKTGAEILALRLGKTNLLEVWNKDANTGAEVVVRRGPAIGVSSASFSPDGSRILTASGDYSATVWNAMTGDRVLILKGHTSFVSSASFSQDGSRVVTASRDKTVKIWDAQSGAELLTLMGHTDPVNSASFSADGSRIVTASDDLTAKVWDSRMLDANPAAPGPSPR
jgi:eukaryotic-like serine/threonine-protein kinase